MNAPSKASDSGQQAISPADSRIQESPIDDARVALDLTVANNIDEIERTVMQIVDACRPLVASPKILSLNIPVALTEALANAMLRGNHNDPVQQVRVMVRVSDDVLLFDVIDQGSGFDLSHNIRDPARNNNVEREDGRGLFLMRELMDNIEQFRDVRGNVVRLTIRRNRTDIALGFPKSVSKSERERRLELEIENAARELAERYEEINLLYSISEILGRTAAWGEAVATILHEVSETVGAHRAAIFVAESKDEILRPIAVLGADIANVSSIVVDNESSVPARVFRTRTPAIIDPSDSDQGDTFRSGAMLAVPVTGVTQGGHSELLGVMVLTDRRPRLPFSAGDVKLMVAIATQIGNALQNARLVRASIEQERLSYEMRLAHDLQMKLLPAVAVVAPQATVAARVIPAESVGGDFYHLLKLSPSATGVLVGDVSGHGFRAALIMALALSAASIHAQATTQPDIMLQAFFRSLQDELENTEMFISVFYGVVNSETNTLHYANAGLPHAFICRNDCVPERLHALNPPLGMVDDVTGIRTTEWHPGKDTLVIFTDGVPDAVNDAGARLGEKIVLDVVQSCQTGDPEYIIESVLTRVRSHTAEATQFDDMTVLVLRG